MSKSKISIPKSKYEIPLRSEKTIWYRAFEILPGLLTWSVLVAPLVLAFISPVIASVFIILYMVGWITKAIVMIFRVVQGYRRVEQYSSLDWDRYLSDFDDIDSSHVLETAASYSNNRFDVQHYDRLSEFKNHSNQIKPRDVIHAVVYPIYNESLDTLIPSMESIVDSEYDLSKIWLYVAYEERGGEQVEKDVKYIQQQYKNTLGKIVLIKHPDGIPGEVIGKGGNIYLAGKRVISDIDKADIDHDRVVVTTLDADNRPHRKYFAALTYHFVSTDDKTSLSYQPIPLYTNNVWDVPAPIRVASTGNSFYQVIQSTRPHLLRNFSSHAQGLSGLVKTDLWSVRTVVEDGHQFWRSFVMLKGNYDVVPIFVPIYQDAVLSNNFVNTFKAQFKQRRRWAYGCSDIPYFIIMWWRNRKELPFFRSASRLIRRIESEVSLATASLILAFGSWGPFIVDRFIGDSESIVALKLPGYAQILRNIALIGIPVSIYLGLKILTPKPERYKRRQNLWMVLQWGWLPVAAMIFGTLAALNAQTRLLTARYLEVFEVTEKHIKK